jgi:hypothetical protein
MFLTPFLTTSSDVWFQRDAAAVLNVVAKNERLHTVLVAHDGFRMLNVCVYTRVPSHPCLHACMLLIEHAHARTCL